MMSLRMMLSTVVTIPLLTPTPIMAQDQFQGVVTYILSAGSQEVEVKYMAKGDKVRQEMTMPGMPGPVYILIDMSTQKTQTVMESMGMYVETDIKAAIEMAGEAQVTKGELPSFRKLGTSGTFAGVDCDNYALGKDEEIEACIAPGLGWMMGGGGMMRRGPSAPDFSSFRSEFKNGLFPLQVIQVKDGKRTKLLEVKSIDRTTLDPKLFILPSGLRKMPGMGG